MSSEIAGHVEWTMDTLNNSDQRPHLCKNNRVSLVPSSLVQQCSGEGEFPEPHAASWERNELSAEREQRSDTLAPCSPSRAATGADLCAGKSATHRLSLPAPGRGSSSLTELRPELGRDATLTASEHLAPSTVGVGIQEKENAPVLSALCSVWPAPTNTRGQRGWERKEGVPGAP